VNQGESGGARSGVDELESVYEAALQAMRSGDAVAVATVVSVQGSGPRAAGAKMVVYPDGRECPTVRLWYNGPASQTGGTPRPRCGHEPALAGNGTRHGG